MHIRFLGKGGSPSSGCPSLYETDADSFLVQGWRSDDPNVVEIPHLLLGFAEDNTFIGAALTDTSRGTFTLRGKLVTDPQVLAQLELAENETIVEVPKCERTFYGAVVAG